MDNFDRWACGICWAFTLVVVGVLSGVVNWHRGYDTHKAEMKSDADKAEYKQLIDNVQKLVKEQEKSKG